MKITKEMKIGLISMVAIARNGDKALTATAIAENQGLTKPFVEKIFSKLRRAGMVNAIKGPGGGYQMAKELNSISVGDIFEILSSGKNKDSKDSETAEQKIAENLIKCHQGISSKFLKETTLDVLLNGNLLKTEESLAVA